MLPLCRYIYFFPKCLFGFVESMESWASPSAMGWRSERTTIVCEQGVALLWKRVAETDGGTHLVRPLCVPTGVHDPTMRKGVAAVTSGEALLRSTCKLA